MARSTGKRADVPPSVGGGLCRQGSISKGTTLLALNNHQYCAEPPSRRTVGSVHCRCRRRDRVRRRGQSRAGGCRPWLRAMCLSVIVLSDRDFLYRSTTSSASLVLPGARSEPILLSSEAAVKLSAHIIGDIITDDNNL